MKKSSLFLFLASSLSVVGGCGGSGSGNTSGGGGQPATHFSVTAPATATAGTVFNFTVTALDASNSTVASYSGTVHFSSSDGQAVLPANSTLTNGTGTFSATLKNLGGQTITATDTVTASIIGTSNSINVNTPAASHFSVTGPASSAAGFTFSFTVTALDASNNTVTAYSGTLHFTSTDPHAQLPPDSTLVSGSKVFSATLTTAGNQVITATDTATASIAGSSNPINVGALAGAFPVETFGARGDGKTDDTAAIQNAINAAAAAGGGSVVFKVARYFTTGSFVVPAEVVLCGAIEGPFDVAGVNPAVTAIAPTLLVTNTSAPFLTLQGIGAGVADLLFHYPNQVKTTASAPTVYPYTIAQVSPGAKVVRSTVTNAYNFLDIEIGDTMDQDLFIGAFNIGINIDHTRSFVTLHNLHNGVFWDEVESASYPTTIDTWVLNHGTALVVGRMDSLDVHNFFVFSRFAGMLLTDSPDTTQNPPCGYARGSDIDLETVQYGIIVTASNSPGYEFTNVVVGASSGSGQAAVQLRAGGSIPPDVLINGGSARGTWALGAFPTPAAGHLTVVNIIGFNLP